MGGEELRAATAEGEERGEEAAQGGEEGEEEGQREPCGQARRAHGGWGCPSGGDTG